MSLIELKEEVTRTFLIKVNAINDEVILREILSLLDSIKVQPNADTAANENKKIEDKFASVLQKVS